MRFKHMNIYRLSSVDLLTKELPHKLLRAGYTELVQTNDYLYAPGEIPILMVSHVDTVHRRLEPEIWFDKKSGILTAPNGIGGDDRAGVSGIIELINNGFKPHVLFTEGEETGGRGASAAAQQLPAPDVRYMIELDRRGYDDAVFYNLDNEKFERFIEKFSFKKQWGSFSDISVIAPAWGIAAVNLSIGYYCPHTDHEYVRLDEWEATLHKVATMFNFVPEKTFRYFGKPTVVYSKWDNRWKNSNWPEKKDNVVHLNKPGELNAVDRAKIIKGTLYDDDYYDNFYNGYGRDNFGGVSDQFDIPDKKVTCLKDPDNVLGAKSAKESAQTFLFDAKGNIINQQHMEAEGMEEEDQVGFIQMLTPDDLADMYGGTVGIWSEWLEKNLTQLEEIMEDMLWDTLDKMTEDDMCAILCGRVTTSTKFLK
jgi:hypothetical protein